MYKKIDKYYIFLILIGLFFVFLVTPTSHLFGSSMDWVSQHIAFPHYFRQLFYETGDLFPDFALAIGAGQNIFHFSYYGLLNPFLLLSYFFPFLDMVDYLVGMNIILYIFSSLFLYKWLTRHFTKQISFLGGIFLLCASPFLFHFHRHFMFVSYMPFVILGLIGVESYFEKGNYLLLLFCTFFIILISYFYSIPSILVFVIYGIFCYLKKEKKITFQKFIKDGLFFILPIFAGILLSSFFLLPTFYAVFSGRGGSVDISFWNLFLPRINGKALFYDHYGIGLTSLAFLSLFYGIFMKKKEYKFLSFTLFILLCFPIFSYLLNGTLYIRSKVFIPFLPLFIFMISSFLSHFLDMRISRKFYFYIPPLLPFLYLFGMHEIFFYLDVCVTLFMIWFISKYKKRNLLYLFLFIPIGVLLFVNRIDHFVEKDFYEDSTGIPSLLREKIKKDPDIFRVYHLQNSLYNVNRIYGSSYYTDSLYSSVYHEDYKLFYEKIFQNPLSHRNRLVTSQNNNVLYQIYMGGKYMYGDKNMIGYEKIGDSIYQNNDVFPMFYVSNHLFDEDTFDLLPYPDRIFALFQNTVVEKGNSSFSSKIEVRKDLQYFVSDQKNIEITNIKDGYKIVAKENNKLTLSLPTTFYDQIVLVDFSLGKEWDCKKGDSVIVINGRQNTFTCDGALYKNKNKVFHYVLSDPVLKDIEITFHKGTYFINKIHTYAVDYNSIAPLHKSFTKMKVDKKRTKGDVIEGSVNASSDGYFVTSIPYDKGFTIYDNDVKIKYEKVNKAFLGFPIQKGFHHIRIEYHAPLFLLGKCISFCTLFFLCIWFYIDYRNNYRKNKYNKMTNKIKK